MKPSRCGRISHHLHVTARIEMTSHDLSMRRVLPLWATAATTVSKKSQLPFKESQFSSLTLPPMKRQDVQHWLIGVEIQDSPKRREISPSEASDFQDRPLSTDDLEMLSSPRNSVVAHSGAPLSLNLSPLLELFTMSCLGRSLPSVSHHRSVMLIPKLPSL